MSDELDRTDLKILRLLQDLERGRAMEIDALVAAVQELGRLTEVPTPTIDAVLALVKLRGFKAGAYGLEF